MAASADTNEGSNTGSHVMLVGIILQLHESSLGQFN
ncbi:hypothetical protein CVT25_006095 [Psilocybe cyanescens]|uniref:Uncharacterized protein n=1 Tax=Psilocybe cyanescens TaxID=93625 RepID=A0A409VUS8_PSICY|nr:hypothetical protein CVT25_006095 [Psilocybe cyanescens]